MWKNIWKVKDPIKVAFFTWMTDKGKILTIDILRKRNFCIADWCCICKVNGESLDHLLLHCGYTQILWSLVFCLFSLSWVMPKHVVDLLDFGGRGWADVWGVVPLCYVDYLERPKPANIQRACALAIGAKTVFVVALVRLDGYFEWSFFFFT